MATMLLTLAMQDLVRRATALSWAQMVAPQVPALVCGALVAGAAWGAGAVLHRRHPAVGALVILGTQLSTAVACYGAFVLFSRFRALREVVDETLHEALPAGAVRWLNRVGVATLPSSQA